MEISFALQYLSRKEAKQMLTAHPQEYLLFGSDSPWVDQAEYIAKLKDLQLNKTLFTRILSENGQTLL